MRGHTLADSRNADAQRRGFGVADAVRDVECQALFHQTIVGEGPAVWVSDALAVDQAGDAVAWREGLGHRGADLHDSSAHVAANGMRGVAVAASGHAPVRGVQCNMRDLHEEVFWLQLRDGRRVVDEEGVGRMVDMFSTCICGL